MNTDTTSHRVTEVRNWQTKYSERAPVYFHLDGVTKMQISSKCCASMEG